MVHTSFPLEGQLGWKTNMGWVVLWGAMQIAPLRHIITSKQCLANVGPWLLRECRRQQQHSLDIPLLRCNVMIKNAKKPVHLVKGGSVCEVEGRGTWLGYQGGD